MASIPQFFTDQSFYSDFSQFPYPVIAGDSQNYGDHPSASSGTISSGAISASSGGGGAIWGDDQTFPISFDNVLPPESDVVSPPTMTMSFPCEHFGFVESLPPVPTLPDYNSTAVCGVSGIQNFGARLQHPDVCEFGDECCGYMQDFKPPYPAAAAAAAAAENWVLISFMSSLTSFYKQPPLKFTHLDS